MDETSPRVLEVNVRGVHRWLPAYVVPVIACLALLISLGDQRWRLSLRGGVIRGPGRWSLFPLEVPLAELDRERSALPKNPDAVRLLWSTDGRVIAVHPHAYRPAELAAFLAALGLA